MATANRIGQGFFVSLTVLVSLTSLACANDGKTPTEPIAVARIEITSSISAPFSNETFSVSASVTDAAGNSLDRSVVWTSSITSILTVASTGARSAKVTTNLPGTARITGAVEGRTGQLDLTVRNRPLQSAHAFIYSATEGFLDIPELPGAKASFAVSVNNNGEVVGGVDLPGGTHAFIWSKSEGMTDLGLLPRQTYAFATAINDAGQVAGYSGRNSFRWSRSGGMVALADSPTLTMVANSINNNGDIVGVLYGNGTSRPFRWTAASGLQELRTASGEQAEANDINDSGQIVGSIFDPNDDYNSIRGVLWNNAGAILDITKCDNVNSCSAGALSINQKGQVVGFFDNKSYLWSQQSGTVFLPLLNGSALVSARGINASGQVTGSAYFSFGTGMTYTDTYRAFVWSESAGMRDIGDPTGRLQTVANAINDKGQIVGWAGAPPPALNTSTSFRTISR